MNGQRLRGKSRNYFCRGVNYFSGLFWIQFSGCQTKIQASVTDPGPRATESVWTKRMEGEGETVR